MHIDQKIKTNESKCQNCFPESGSSCIPRKICLKVKKEKNSFTLNLIKRRRKKNLCRLCWSASEVATQTNSPHPVASFSVVSTKPKHIQFNSTVSSLYSLSFTQLHPKTETFSYSNTQSLSLSHSVYFTRIPSFKWQPKNQR